MKKIFLFSLLSLISQISFGQVIWSDDFESGIADWTIIDGDGDGNEWGLTDQLLAASGSNCMVSYSFINGVGAVTPNNYLISPVLDLTSATGTILVDWKAYAQDQAWASEHYLVVVADNNTQAAVDAGTVIYDGIVGANGEYITETGNISSFAGEVVFIAIVHNNSTDQFSLNIDDVSVYTSNTADVGVTAVAAPSNVDGCDLSSLEVVTVTVTNFGGTDAADFEVSYTVNGGTPVVETVSTTVAPAGTYEHTFAEPADLSNLGEYAIEAKATITDDSDASNDATTLNVRNSDATITVHVMSDQSNGHSWTIRDNTTGDVMATRGAYQWNIEVFDDVCVYKDGCYTFEYEGEMGAGAFLEILFDGVPVAGDTDGNGIAANLEFLAVGGGCAANDVALTDLTFDQYQLVNSSVDIKGNIRNFGADPISEVTATYSVDGGSGVSQTFTGLNVLQGNVVEITFDEPFTLTQEVVSEVNVTIETVNGEMDNMVNNSQDGKIIPITEVPVRNFVVEEGTGTWCPWCPRGDIGVKTITEDHDDAIAIAVHNDDPMDIGNYDGTLFTFIGATGYPFSSVNRSLETDPSAGNLEAAYQTEKNKIVPASIAVQARVASDLNDITVDVTTDIFAIEMNGNYQISVVITEDGVTGTGNDYAQANNYAGGGQGMMGGYENLPNPVPASQMVYDHVARLQLGGFDGDAGSFPTTANNNDKPTFQYTGTASTNWDFNKLHAVALLLDMDNGGQIVNAASVPVEVLSNINDVYQNDLAKVYPNPFTDVTVVNLELEKPSTVSLEVVDAMGKKVAFRNYGTLSGAMNLPFNGSNLESGIYFMHIQVGDKMVSKKVMILR